MEVIKKQEFIKDLATRGSLQQAIKDNTIEAIPIDCIKQAEKDISSFIKFPSPKWVNTTLVDIKDVYRIFDKLIAESEDLNEN